MKYKLLYVDDEPANLRAFLSVFRREYDIFTTDSPTKGLDHIRNNNVDLIITDQRMPEMTGIEFLKKVNELKPNKPPNRMILSGYSQTKAIEEAKEKYQLSIFVSKPWDPNELKTKIETAISQCCD